MSTYVKSINGYQGSKPFRQNTGIILDANDIKVSGNTGSTIKAKCLSIANNVRMLNTTETAENDDYKIQIINYPLSITN
jgi:hypothetical protein